MIVDTLLNGLTESSIEPLAIGASADHKFRIPNETVGAGELWRNTKVVEEDFVSCADAGFGEVVPNLATNAGVGHTVQVSPDSRGRALARPGVLVPDGSTLAVLDHSAELVVPLSSGLADAVSGCGIPDLAVCTENTSSAVPVESGWAVAL